MEILIWSYQLQFYFFHLWFDINKEYNIGLSILCNQDDRGLFHFQIIRTRLCEKVYDYTIYFSIFWIKTIKKEF